MDQPVARQTVHAFKHFRLDRHARQLMRQGADDALVRVTLGARALDILIVLVLGLCHLLLGDIERALTSLRTARALDPSMHHVHWWLAAALGLNVELDEAKAASIVLTRQAGPRFTALSQRAVFPGPRQAGWPEP